MHSRKQKSYTLLLLTALLCFLGGAQMLYGYSQSYYQGYYQNYYQASYDTTFSSGVSFSSSLYVDNAISKSSGTFVIDHPLDPENKLLYHSFVESPDVKNLYDGVIELDKNGEATILLPDYFDVLNTDFRYQVKGLSVAMPSIHVKEEFTPNQFSVGGGVPFERISWQITASRQDPYILANPIIPEVEKGPDELVDKGEYLFDGYAQ